MKQKTTVVFFDAGGTLFRPYPSVGAVYAKVAADHGVHVDADQVEKAFHQHWHSRNGLSTLAGLSSEKIEREWWRQMVLDVFTTPSPSPADSGGGTPTEGIAGGSRMPFKDFDAFFQELYDLFARAECWRLFDDTIPTLEALKKSGMRLAIISNWDHRLFSIVEQLGLSHYFEHVTASSKVGIAKPGKGIFEAALKAAGIEAAHGLHIGDSLEDDYHGATRAGMQAVFLDRHRKYASQHAERGMRDAGSRPSSKEEPVPRNQQTRGAGEGSISLKTSSSRTPHPESRTPSGVAGGEGFQYNDLVVVHTLGDLIPLL